MEVVMSMPNEEKNSEHEKEKWKRVWTVTTGCVRTAQPLNE